MMLNMSVDDFNFEKRNFENLIYIHREDLKKILRGYDVNKIFTTNERNKLRDNNILKNKNGKLYLTEKALEVLSKIE